MGPMFLSAEERAKKDDDLRAPGTGFRLPLFRSRWAPSSSAHRSRVLLRRLVLVLMLALLVYLFIHNMPDPVPNRPYYRPLYNPIPGKQDPGGPSKKAGPNQGSATAAGESDFRGGHSSGGYNGPFKLERLSESLQNIRASTGGGYSSNRNVLFAAASLRSAALLLPLACGMANERHSHVHLALMGGSGVEIGDLKAVNGVDESCEVIFHDGRPNMATQSSNKRLKQATIQAIYDIHQHMHPQALIVDASEFEEDYFLAGAREVTAAFGITLIELPENGYSKLGWITKLDSSSLAAWGNVKIEILVPSSQAVPGSLTHLLSSLSAADFSAGPIPHLTLELPPQLDRPTAEYLKNFQWPPGRRTSSSPSQLTLRHRIPRARLTEEESSVRFLESFWPSADQKHSHVLVLSPHVEVSAQFFHYLKYTILHYLYSHPAQTHDWDARLLGISLDLPATLLDDTPFNPPSSPSSSSTSRPTTPFLWQAPNSHAFLFVGPKWAELHALVSQTLAYQHHNPHATHPDKLVGTSRPAWLEHVLRLARARGYVALYPSPTVARHLAVAHSELHRPPEEYANAATNGSDSGISGSELPLAVGSVLDLESLLPSSAGRLPLLEELPLLAWDGKETTVAGLESEAKRYVDEFRRKVGGCDDKAAEEVGTRQGSLTRDLFCFGAEE